MAIVTGALTDRVLFEGRRASGVAYLQGGRAAAARARTSTSRRARAAAARPP
jgi:choline dehydrogenase